MADLKKEALRYLGYRGQEITPEIERMLAEAIAELQKVQKPKVVKAVFDVEICNDEIVISGTNLVLRGEKIKSFLSGAEKILLFAATLGVEVDALISAASSVNVTKSVMLDACATAMIEELCDSVCKRRFSPGYGDLPLEIQPELLSVLNAQRKIGLTCTPQFIMLPRKSVTAICRRPDFESHDGAKSCASCEKKDCEYKNA